MRSPSPGELAELKAAAFDAIDEAADDVWELALYLHENPELGGRERASVAKITSLLRSRGFSVEVGVAGMDTAFVASAPGSSGRPSLAYLAEYDALPGIGHACGHNLIAASSVAAALGASSALPSLGGSVAVVGTPGEENIGGKVIMVREGVFSGFDAALMAHPGDRWSLDQRLLALTALEFTFRGRSSHAAAAPEEGRDALDAVVLFINGINALREHVKPDVRMHGIVAEGGRAPNVVPDRTVYRMYVRASTRERVDEVVSRVLDAARGAALMTGCEVEWREYELPLDEMRVSETLIRLFESNAALLGVKEFKAHEGLGSSDVGNVSRVIPTIQPTFKIVREGVPPHTEEFARAAASEEAREATLKVAKILAATGVDLLADPGLLERARSEIA